MSFLKWLYVRTKDGSVRFALFFGGILFLVMLFGPREELPRQAHVEQSDIAPIPAPKISPTIQPKAIPEERESQKELWNIHNQDIISRKLRDPSSAQFRNVFYSRLAGPPVTCGEVNSKNGFGGYVGYQRFVAAGESIAVLESEVRDFGNLWKKVCRNR